MVLNDKLKREAELKNLLGVTFVEEMRHDFVEGFNSIKSTTAWVNFKASLFEFKLNILGFFKIIKQILFQWLSPLKLYLNTIILTSFQKAAQTFTDLGSTVSSNEA